MNFIECGAQPETRGFECRDRSRRRFHELIHLANIAYRVGRTLHFDEKTMTVGQRSGGNKLFTRDYRKPFVVPKLA